MVKELRERSGAGMMECKKALAENNGDIDTSMEWLRKQGLAKADKKAGRVAAEGRIALAQDGGKAVLVEINCETDFVAKDENFLKFSDNVAQTALRSDAADVDALKAAAYPGADTSRKAAKADRQDRREHRRCAAWRASTTTARFGSLRARRPDRRAGRAEGRRCGAGRGHCDAHRRDEPEVHRSRGRPGRICRQGKRNRAGADGRQGQAEARRDPGKDDRRQDQEDAQRNLADRAALRA